MNGLSCLAGRPAGIADDCFRHALGMVLLSAAIAGNICYFSDAAIAGCPRPQDEVWYVDTRPAGCNVCAAGDLPQLRVERASARGCWEKADVDALLAAKSDFPTFIWVHGNRIEAGEARQHGWDLYRGLCRQAGDFPVRLVIWSWPADQIRGPLQDVRYKAQLTEPAAFHLARVLRRMDAETPVGLIGFSYGARIITGALHLTEGGNLAGYRLPQSPQEAERRNVRTVLWASALHDHWLLPGQYHGRALAAVERATLLNNSSDRALRRYRWLDRCTRPEALGYLGLPCTHQLGPLRSKVQQADVACQVGPVHDECTYISDAYILRQTWCGVQSEVLLAEQAKQQQARLAKQSRAKAAVQPVAKRSEQPVRNVAKASPEAKNAAPQPAGPRVGDTTSQRVTVAATRTAASPTSQRVAAQPQR